MGKSNNVYNKRQQVYQKEKNLFNFLQEDEIKILEKINNCFIHQFVIDCSNFIKSNIKLVSCGMKVESYNSNKKSIKNFNYCNLIEILPYKKQSFIIFSCNFLSVIIDLLFGGKGNFQNKTHIKIDVNSTEFFIHKKIINLIINILSSIYNKYFSSEISLIDTKIVINSKEPNFDSNEIFLITSFNLHINNVEVFFSTLIPLSILKKINKNAFVSINNEQKYIKKKDESKISLNNIHDIILNIEARINNVSIPYDKFYTLSVGDILPIENPNKVIGYIENKPIFIGKYKRFHEQKIVFIEKFINSNLDSNKDEEYFHE
ncbi:flagellar motor switch protein FliM [Buchnera aphidicola (Hyperomyzus lactucae)]|uniref:Flagellar motor switch protein FliM n=1 Tax=Buchnera aphidicola (Hyperomyzus lactucae) TaxID=1241860 RepID=A0A4D6XT02_9GAMM|nr:FliM/FliN family flagellar motor switch protein [Buchnera aphidicola]QCI20822.1 flagellar motor switch protein FliM [Buchnera aphidicola (Hyperomyzus lactucae)]